MTFMCFRSGYLHPAREGWIEKLTKLMDRYFFYRYLFCLIRKLFFSRFFSSRQSYLMNFFRFYLCEVRQAVRLRILELLQVFSFLFLRDSSND